MTTSGLQEYHYAWLSDHPERTEDWLLRMMAEGFHIHHVDGDHDNNDPLNLVLIEGGDHLLIHNGVKRPVTFISKRRAEGVKRPSEIQLAERRKESRKLHNVLGQMKSTTRTELLRRAVEAANALRA